LSKRDKNKKRGYTPRNAATQQKAPNYGLLAVGALAVVVIGVIVWMLMPKGGGNEITTASGLKYEDIVVGSGASPSSGKNVTVHYTGTLTNGTKFDSSRDRNQPYTFAIGTGVVIPGWDEGVMSMKVGGRRKLTIPGKLAYGPEGRPPTIPPNATLLFDIELLDVK
jgi:peptidylprolyl isomerase